MPAEAPTIPSPRSKANARPASRILGDERLASLVCEGNRDAFSLLYERYERPLYRYCLAILRQPDDARDALQVTMLNAFRSLSERTNGDGIRVRPWLYRIAHNAAISLARERRKHDELPPQLSSNRLPIDDLLERELAEQILLNLSELPSRRRGALVMRELQGLPYEEIATALDVTPGAARQAVFEARETLANAQANGAVDCREVCQRISLRDGRLLRSRAVRVHLRACESCSRFGHLIRSRRRALAALPPLAVGTRWRILDGILQTASRPEAVTAVAAGAKGGMIGLPLLLKGLAAGAAVLAVGAGSVAVDRIDRDPSHGASPAVEAGAAAPESTSQSGRIGATNDSTADPKATEADGPSRPESSPAPRTPAPSTIPGQASSSGGEIALAAPGPSIPGEPSLGGGADDHEDTGNASPAPTPGGAEAAPVSGETGNEGGSQGADTPPGQQGTPAGEGGTPPGQENQPSQAGADPPGRTSAGEGSPPPVPPGQDGDGPAGTPPGQGGTPPGQGGTPPGQAGTRPGHGGTPPGHRVTRPGQGGTPLGQSVAGSSGAAPGYGGTPPGQGGTPPGQAKN